MTANKIKSQGSVKLECYLNLSENETRALYCITKIGIDNFLKVWKEAGAYSHEISEHKEGLKSLFNTIGEELPKHINKFDKINKFLLENLK